jgi:hypothetical protein
MPTQVTDYTTTANIRAAIGVDDNDLPDAQIVNSQVDVELTIDLDSWLPDHATIYTDGTTGSPTAEEVTSKNYLIMYAMYAGACLVLDGRQLQYPFLFKDGKAELRRFDGISLDKILAALREKRAYYRTKLVTDQSLTETAEAIGFSIVGVSIPAYDPVIGE